MRRILVATVLAVLAAACGGDPAEEPVTTTRSPTVESQAETSDTTASSTATTVETTPTPSVTT
ncbi:MAG: hypothetical protein F4085_04605, partial [Acidimicrobiia bacterium]|nr:hypothetical protein [Acidimicrobiia bacterium]